MENKYEKIIEDGFNKAKDSKGRPSLLTSYMTPLVAGVVNNINEKSEVQQSLVNKIKGEAKLLESKKNELLKQIEANDSTRTTKSEEELEIVEKKKQETKKISDKITKKQSAIDSLVERVGKVEKGNTTQKRTNYGFYIGIPILIFLTIFLWIFYCSALHSALIRDIQSDLRVAYEAKTYDNGSADGTLDDDIEVVASIINLRAVQDAWKRGGFVGVLLVLAAFGFPLAAGLLLYIFKGKPWKVRFTFIGTFLFDVILAYHIVRDIYIARYDTGVAGYEANWEFSLFYQQVSFYMILSIGFVGYVLWGIILSYLLSEKDKYEPLKNEITDRQKEIHQLQKNLEKTTQNFDNRINQLAKDKRGIDEDTRRIKREITDNERQVHSKLQEAELVKSKIPIPKADLESSIESFFAGWCKWIVHHLPTKDDAIEEKAITECEEVKKKFLEDIYNSKEYFIIKE